MRDYEGRMKALESGIAKSKRIGCFCSVAWLVGVAFTLWRSINVAHDDGHYAVTCRWHPLLIGCALAAVTFVPRFVHHLWAEMVLQRIDRQFPKGEN